MNVQATIPEALAEAFGLRNQGAGLTFGLGTVVQPVVLWPTQERAAELVRVLEGKAFMGYADVSGVAAQFAHVQLWNPSTDRRLLVSQVWITNFSGAASIILRHHNVALTTLVSALRSKRIEMAADSAAQLRTQTNAAAIGDPFSAVGAASLATTPLIFKEPVVLEPGCGLMVQHTTVNVSIGAAFEFVEDIFR